MKPADHSAANTNATPGVRSHAHRPRSAVLLLGVLVASLAALLPNAAQAHFKGGHPEGGEIDVTPDGYNEPWHPAGRTYQVMGRDFIPNDIVHLFQCPVTRSRPEHEACQPLGVKNVDVNGNFDTPVYMFRSFTSTQYPADLHLTDQGGVNCYGRNSTPGEMALPLGRFATQCSVVAVSYAPGINLVRSKRAEHYICFEGTSRPSSTSTSLPGDTVCVDQP